MSDLIENCEQSNLLMLGERIPFFYCCFNLVQFILVIWMSLDRASERASIHIFRV